MGPDYKDYYAILGVPKTATEKEIKAAYRKLARKHHPDVNPNNKASEDKFKEVGEAYEILSDKEKRAKYDRFSEQWKAYAQNGGGGNASGFPSGGGGSRPEYGGGAAEFNDLNDLFASLFSGGDTGGGRGTSRGGRGGVDPFAGYRTAAPPPRKGQDFEYPLTVTLDDAFNGATKTLSLQMPGERFDLDRGGMAPPETRRVEVKIPQGVAEGQKIRLAGQGAQSPAGPGDLYLIVKMAPHGQFERSGDDLTVDVPVPYTTAALGGEIRVPTMKGTNLTMRIPAGTQSGQKFRLTGQGMPRLRGGSNGTTHGDLYARTKMTVPKQLSDRERELLTELAALVNTEAAR